MRKKTEARHQAIVDAAEEVFQLHGFEKASMEQICQQVGYSKATLYKYFPSKAALFHEVMTVAIGSEFEALLDSLRQSDKNLETILNDYGNKMLNFRLSPRIMHVHRLMSASTDLELIETAYRVGPAKVEQAMRQFMEEKIRSGQLQQADPILMARQLQALVEAEWVFPIMMPSTKPLKQQDIKRSVKTAIQTFLSVYQIQ